MYENTVLDNIGLVHYVIRQYGLQPSEDLIHEGVCGLLEATKRYDRDKGKFSTYAYYCILKRVAGYMRTMSHPVVLSTRSQRAIMRLYKAMREDGTFRKEDISSISLDCGISHANMLSLASFTNTTSLDGLREDDDLQDCHLLDALHGEISAEDATIDAEFRRVIMEAFAELTLSQRIAILYPINRAAKALKTSRSRIYLIRKQGVEIIRETLKKKGYLT